MNVLSHLNTLETAGLIRVAQVTPDLEYLFRHTLVQDAAYASLLEEDQARLHLEVGEVLEKLYADHLEEWAATLADHFEKAGDLERAFRYYAMAAGKSLAAYANQEAESHFRCAIQISQDPARLADMLSGLGEALFQQSRYEEAIQAWQGAIQKYGVLENKDRIARLYARSARAAWFIETPRGLQLCKDGLATVGEAPESPGLAMLVHEAARAYYFNGFPAQASQLCRQALEMAGRLGDIEVRADALATLGILQDIPDEEALAALQQAVELAEAHGFLSIATRASLNLGTMMKNIKGDMHAAHDHFFHSAELAKRRGSVQEEFIARIAIASVSLYLGELLEVEGVLATLAELQKSLSDPAGARLEWNLLQASLLVIRGETQQAIPILRSGIDEARQRGDLQTLLGYFEIFLEAHFLLDTVQGISNWGDVEAALESAHEISLRGIVDKAWIYTQYCTLKTHQNKFSEAHKWLDDARQSAIGKTNTIMDLLIAQAEAELAMAEKHWDEALNCFNRMEAQKSQLSYFFSGWMLVIWADALLAKGELGDLEQAQGHLLEAHTIFEKMGSQSYINLVKERIQKARLQTYALAVAQKKVSVELAQAGLLQESFLPEQPPSLPGWQMSAVLKPARATTGDFYDFIPLPGGKLGIVIADVTDKGMGAALFMTSSRTLLRAYAAEYPDQPGLVLNAVNRQITQNTRGGLYVTLFYGILDPTQKSLRYSNAGHNPPCLLRGVDSFEELLGTGIPLGVFESASWEVGDVQCSPGSALVLYTDGVTEAQNQHEKAYGSKRLIQAAQTAAFSPDRSAEAIQQAILRSVAEFSKGVPQMDDITLVIIACEK